MQNDPIAKFHLWWSEVKEKGNLKHPGAVCVSTVAEDGFPSARFVDLKSAAPEGFIFCTWFDSQKGKEINHNNKVALTFWWEALGYQVRIAGHARPVSEQQSEEYWSSRSREAQLATLCFQQSQPLVSESAMLGKFQQAQAEAQGQPIKKPPRWGGMLVVPQSIEFLTFRDNRLHLRELYDQRDQTWHRQLLQP
ncbi:pyridoxamine 5'-phosphate oxidase [Erwinia piriflorinigrans]|uniref:Pyridoxamine 5'-phosphate oxidase n=1 Tax=Erwinia piriflorinigrans CFBP 5888 TaxID=1161919 RepID=V5Z9M9_9GAMM|nr:pyridoxamine 5'-phosphate oxidase [Erwinia piriflorinigrans]CCG88058.1 pyridoxamine 5'-phosphate oxidase [Erwinia piriflorinigrans CFBP 5888]